MNTDAWIVPEWPAPDSVRAVVTTRRGPGISKPPFDAFNLGARCGDEPQAVEQNRARLREALQLPSPPCWLRQVHGTDVAEFNPAPHPDLPPQAEEAGELRSALTPRPFTGQGSPRMVRTGGGNAPGQEPDADAAHTRTPGVVLAILTADCMPVLFCARDGSEIAAAHAGWRGLCAGVLENTLATVRASRESVLAWLGPSIGAHSYEVGDEVRQAFLERDRAAAEAFQPTRPGHWQCDLYALARQRLRAAGITQIFGGGFDTFADPRLYSYRRDGARSGRFASLIWMEALSGPANRG